MHPKFLRSTDEFRYLQNIANLCGMICLVLVSRKTNKIKTHLLILPVMFLWLIASPLRYVGAQEHKPASYLDFGAGFFQVKDGKNYGLVFNGGMLNTSYMLRGHHGNHLYDYRVDFGFGPSFAKGIAGINFKLNPVNIDYLFRLAGNSSFKLYLGPYLGLNYQFQLYPELQSALLGQKSAKAALESAEKKVNRVLRKR